MKFISKKDANETIEFIVKKLREWISEIQEREYVFGCYLFGNSDIESFSIGPVRFEPRNKWLARVHTSGGLSRIAVSRIERIWKGEKLRERRPSEDETCERRALDTIGKCDFVCSVAIGALGSNAGLQKALQGAHLATTAIALGWNSPSWALTRIFVTYDRQPIVHECLVLFPGRSMGWRISSSDRPPGSVWFEKKDWNQILSNFGSVFSCAEEIIKYVTSGSGRGGEARNDGCTVPSSALVPRRLPGVCRYHGNSEVLLLYGCAGMWEAGERDFGLDKVPIKGQ